MKIMTMTCLIVAVTLALTTPADAGVTDCSITSMKINYNTNVAGYIVDVFTVPGNFCNTGLDYDLKNHVLICARHKGKDSGLVFLDKKTGEEVVPPLITTNVVASLQGLAYDSSDDTFWLWGGPPTGEPSKKGRWIHHCTRDGKKLDDGFAFNLSSGMLSYDEELDSLWAKPNNDQTVCRICCKTGRLVETLNTGMMGGEGIALDPFDRTFWILLQKEIYHVSMDGLDVTILGTYPNPSHNYPPDMERLVIRGNDISFSRTEDGQDGVIHVPSGGLSKTRTTVILVEGSEHNDGRHWLKGCEDNKIIVDSELIEEPAGNTITITRETYGSDEGMIVDPIDRTLWLNADQHTHGRTPGGNRCWHVDPLGTYNRILFFPQAIPWTAGVLENMAIENNTLLTAPDATHASYVSAVIDFGEHRYLSDEISKNGQADVVVEYRGSDQAPTTNPDQPLCLPYYPATQANQGWGDTKPDEWSKKIPETRYVQFRLRFDKL